MNKNQPTTGGFIWTLFASVIPIELAPMPRLGDRSLLMGYNVVMGLREDNLYEMPDKGAMKLEQIRDKHERRPR